MLYANLGLSNKAWWGTQSQPNLYETKKQGKSHGENPTLKRDSNKTRKEEITLTIYLEELCMINLIINYMKIETNGGLRVKGKMV